MSEQPEKSFSSMNEDELRAARKYWLTYKQRRTKEGESFGAADRYVRMIDGLLEKLVEEHVVLRSGDLLRADGFSNGGLLEPFLIGYSLLGRSGWLLNFEQEVLARCVEQYLLPMLPHFIAINRYSGRSNPVRLDKKDCDKIDAGVSVRLSKSQVRAIAERTENDMRRPELG